jgi:hypothetical protein
MPSAWPRDCSVTAASDCLELQSIPRVLKLTGRLTRVLRQQLAPRADAESHRLGDFDAILCLLARTHPMRPGGRRPTDMGNNQAKWATWTLV